ncbi:hypothetical protein A0H77_19530 [Vibrio alginolyticus]|uniref:hypothetical protein n=1 Tax=Vibrio alginolyticus TaxID=663 RepID=UPI00079AED39|nr:hypothetical protein [Vibrio alginolyticus]KXZ35090.1 hypothetical protein A0H77_19530 [Vibrio alginolyticus]
MISEPTEKFLNLVKTHSAYKKYDGLDLIEENGYVVITKFPFVFEQMFDGAKDQALNVLKRKMSNVLKTTMIKVSDDLSGEQYEQPDFDMEIEFEPEVSSFTKPDDFNSEPSFDVKNMAKSVKNTKKNVSFVPSDDSRVRPAPAKILFTLNGHFFDEIDRSRVFNNDAFGTLRRDLESYYDTEVLLTAEHSGMLKSLSVVGSGEEIELEDETLSLMAIFLNKGYKKAYRHKQLPQVIKFKEFLSNGIRNSAGKQLEPLHQRKGIVDFFKKNKIALDVATTTHRIINELNTLEVAIFHQLDEPRIKAYDKNKALVSKAIDNAFLDKRDTILHYMNPMQHDQLANLYSHYVSKMYVEAVYYDIDNQMNITVGQ